VEWRHSTLLDVPLCRHRKGLMTSVIGWSRELVSQYFDKPVDGCTAMLYDAVHHHCLWSVDGDDFYKRTSRSHRDQVLFGADSFPDSASLGSLNP
jgi:hypothetical protein